MKSIRLLSITLLIIFGVLANGVYAADSITKDTGVVGEHWMVQHRQSILNIANRFSTISLVIEPHEPESTLLQEI